MMTGASLRTGTAQALEEGEATQLVSYELLPNQLSFSDVNGACCSEGVDMAWKAK